MNEHASLLSKLAHLPIVHAAIRRLDLQRAAGALLARRPLVRRSRRLGLRYRVRFLESLLVADELWKREIYAAAFDFPVKTFIDVGTNVGYFPCYAAEATGRRDLVGLAIDANPAVIEEARWHAAENGLSNVRVLHGLVGHPRDVKEATLFIAGSNVSASAQPRFNPNYPLKADVESTKVPCIDVLEEWKRLAGDARVDLLKVDIEGFEEAALENLRDVLALTDAVAIEWHNWMTSRDAITRRLAASGFELYKLVSEDADAGIGVFRRRTPGAVA